MAQDSNQQATASDDDRCFDTKGVAEHLGISVDTLNHWRLQGKGPAFFRFGGRVRYQLRDVRAYMKACRVSGSKWDD